MAIISLTEYAERKGISPKTARDRAARGAFKTAKKIGRNWTIDEDEPLIDHRFKKMNIDVEKSNTSETLKRISTYAKQI